MGAPKNIKYSSLTDYILNWYKRPNLPVLPNVKSTYQNIYGLYDMHGLIWEWTSNFNSYITSMDSRGNNSDDQKLFCAAGSLNVVDKTDYAGYLRFSYRGSLKGNYCIANLGFRCAKNIN
jgi:formylglycine-generating enzyme required for sulfatase activity